MKPINATPTRVRTGQLSWLENSKISMPSLLYHGYETLDRAAELGSGLWMHNLGQPERFFDDYQKNLPLPVTKWFPNLPEDWIPKDFLGRELEFFHIADSDVFTSTTMSPNQIISWLKVELGFVRLKPSRLKNLFDDPVAMIQTGYRLARLAGRIGLELGSGLVAASLCLVGLGVLGVPTHRCNKCFRRAMPGQLKCRLHSLSKFAKASDVYAHASTVRRIRIAERTCNALNWPEDLAPSVKFTNTQIAVCSILWDLDERDYSLWNAQLAHSLKQAPTIKSLLPSNFLELSSAAQLTGLRNLIDENEWMLSRWPVKIAVAEDWFLALQDFSKPRAPGLSSANQRRVSTATIWINEGMPKKLVAERLGISQSYLSKLLERAKKGMR